MWFMLKVFWQTLTDWSPPPANLDDALERGRRKFPDTDHQRQENAEAELYMREILNKRKHDA